MPKQKGGLILPYKDEKKTSEIFLKYLENSTIKYLTRGTFGLTYVSKLRIGSDSIINPEERYKQLRPDDKYNSGVDTLLIKICIIKAKRDYIEIDDEVKIGTVTEEDFQNEINIQTDIYLKTLQYLQPLCPGIVYSNIFNSNDAVNFLNKIIGNVALESNGDVYINNLKNRFIANSKISSVIKSAEIGLGIIGMEFLDGGNTVHSKIANSLTSKLTRLKYDNYMRYALLKLALDTEYNHGDFHAGNLMVVPDNNYIFNETERIMIIDYGRSLKIPPDVMSQIRHYVQSKNYVKALEQLCLYNSSNEYIMDPQYGLNFYGYVCGNYNIDNDEYKTKLIEQLLDDRNKAIISINNEKIAARNRILAARNLKSDIFKPLVLLPLKNIDDATLEIQSLINNNLEKNIAYKNAGQTFNIEEENQNINDELDKLFKNREKQIDINVQKMNTLHDADPAKYPLIPISNAIKNSLYNGMIGGRRRKTLRRKHRKNRKNKSKKNLSK